MGIEKRIEEYLDEQAGCCIGVREVTIIEEDGRELSRSNTNRRVLHPGEDVSGESEKIQATAAAWWTQDIVDAWQEKTSEI
jgi:hypothetical protein